MSVITGSTELSVFSIIGDDDPHEINQSDGSSPQPLSKNRHTKLRFDLFIQSTQIDHFCRSRPRHFVRQNHQIGMVRHQRRRFHFQKRHSRRHAILTSKNHQICLFI